VWDRERDDREARRQLLLRIAAADGSLQENIRALKGLPPWSFDEPLIVLTRDVVADVLARHQRGLVADAELELWAVGTTV
jgi:hypothetical protein